jgi:hypothetical protein
MAGDNSVNKAILAWARTAGVRLARLVAPPKRLPRASQIVLQHLRHPAQQQARDQFAVRAKASGQSFLRDLVALEENSSRQPGE